MYSGRAVAVSCIEHEPGRREGLFAPLSLSLSLSLFHTLKNSLVLSLSLSFSSSRSLHATPSTLHPRPREPCAACAAPSFSLPFFLSHTLSVSVSLSVCLSLSLYVSLSLSLSFSLVFSLSLSRSFTLCMYLNLSHTHTLSLSLSLTADRMAPTMSVARAPPETLIQTRSP